MPEVMISLILTFFDGSSTSLLTKGWDDCYTKQDISMEMLNVKNAHCEEVKNERQGTTTLPSSL
jgi:hypothetical protein